MKQTSDENKGNVLPNSHNCYKELYVNRVRKIHLSRSGMEATELTTEKEISDIQLPKKNLYMKDLVSI
jgi:hypothetical protein